MAAYPIDWSTYSHTLRQRSARGPLLLPVGKETKKSRWLISWLSANSCLDYEVWKGSLSCSSNALSSSYVAEICYTNAGSSGLGSAKLSEILTSCGTWERKSSRRSCSEPSSRAESYATWPATSPSTQSCGRLRKKLVHRVAMRQTTYREKKAYHFKTLYGKWSMARIHEPRLILTLC